MNHVKIFDAAKIIGLEHITFGEYIIIDDFAFIYAKKTMAIGNFVHIASFSYLTSGGGKITLGDFVAVSSGVKIYTSTDDYVSAGFGNSTINNDYRNLKNGDVFLGKFSIIGANSVILPGVTIGEGASVGANSTVTKDLEPWGVYLGNKRIKDRDQKGIMKNYESFLNQPLEKKIGALFEKKII